MKRTLDAKKIHIELVSIHFNKTYQFLLQIAINDDTEIIQLKKIKDIISDRKDKTLITLI